MRRSQWLAPCLLLAVAACGGREPQNPARLTLINRTGGDVTGAVLRFDGELARVDPVAGGFERTSLRLQPADTLRVEGGRLRPGDKATYRVAGRGGPPRLADAVWLVNGKRGRRLHENEAILR